MMLRGFGGWLASALMGLLMFVLVVLAIVVLIRLARHSGRHPNWQAPQPNAYTNDNTNSALKILDERFAKGEINEEEYTKKKEILKKP